MKHTLKKKFISVIMALFIVLSYSISSVSSVAEAAEVGDGIETTDTSENPDSEYSETDEFTGITERVEDTETPEQITDEIGEQPSDTEDTTETADVSDSDNIDTSTEQGNTENPANVNTSDKQDTEATAEVGSDSVNETNDNSDSLDADINEEESERSLHALITERNSTAEVSVLTSADESDVYVRPTSGIKAEEGLEVIKAYMFAERADNPDEDIWIKADPNERVSLEECETLSLYTIKNNTVDDVIVEDISEDSAPYAIDEDVTGVALVKDTGYRHLNLELDASEDKDDAEEKEEIEVHSDTDAELHSETDAINKEDDEIQDKVVTLDGMMPKAVSAVAVDVTENREAEELKEEEEAATITDADVETSSTTDAKTIVAAYDISLTDGDTEYQPDEEHPIDVEIYDQRILKNSNLELWHIKDDGEKEQITDFTVEDGKVSFSAAGFSVYEIVQGPSKYNVNVQYATTVEELAAEGVYLSYGNNIYVTNTVYKNSGNSVLSEINDISDAAVWYFEKNGENEEYYIYTLVGSEKKYIKQINNSNNIELASSNGSLFTITTVSGKFQIKKNNDTKWLQHSGSGGGIRFWNDANNATNSQFVATIASSLVIPDDVYELDGKTYGLMNYDKGTHGYALMAEDNYVHSMVELVTHPSQSNTNGKTLFVDEGSEITRWTFHKTTGDHYKLSAVTSDGIKYLAVNGDSITMVDSLEAASEFKVTPNNKNQIKLSYDDKNLCFFKSSDEETTPSTFELTASTTNAWFHLVDFAELEDTDYVTYSADRISISDVQNGQKVIVYTRIWDEENKKYDTYAVDHNGTLYPCYASGGKILWLGDGTGSLEWEFTEYYDDVTKEPNYYYELFNPYSEKYIAPQLTGNQVLSEDTIGINMQGRRNGDYYSKIIAWDDARYQYVGLKPSDDNKRLIPCSESTAYDFYFATLEEINLSDSLHEVPTVDNHDFGITMKMKNFEGKKGELGKVDVTADYFNGDYSNKQGLLYSDLNYTVNTQGEKDAGYPIIKSTDGDFKDIFAGATEVNHLFLESVYNSSGYFEFDSCQNYATLLDEDRNIRNDFIVYRELGTHDEDSKATLRHGQFFPYDMIDEGMYSKKNPQNLYNMDALAANANVGKLDESDPRKYEKLYLIEDPDYFFGMEMSANFVQTVSGLDAWGHDIIFEFTGDDDFWLFVDGELVIDLGGTHSAESGSVNFRTGEVKYSLVNSNNSGRTYSSTTLKQIYEKNYRDRGLSESEIQSKIDEIFCDNGKGQYIFRDYTSHTMRVFYMERGAGASNLHMKFNLASVTPGNVVVAKNIEGEGKENLDMDFLEYPFQIFYRLPDDDNNPTGEWLPLKNNDPNDPEDKKIRVTYQNSNQQVRFVSRYRPPGFPENQAYDNIYFINPTKRAEISFPDNAIQYKIVECAVDSTVYEKVLINDQEVPANRISEMQGLISYESEPNSAEEMPTISFSNYVRSGVIRNVKIKKVVWDENNQEQPDDGTFSYRFRISSVGVGEGEEIPLANMFPYYILDHDDALNKDYICRRDRENQTFVKTNLEYTDENIKDVRDGKVEGIEIGDIEFKTSGYGAIADVPAYLTICIPGIPVGSVFQVTEDLKTGYGLYGYDMIKGEIIAADGTVTPVNSYNLLESGVYNSGQVIAGYDPQVKVINKKGYGFTINKKWSDLELTTSHDPVYVAVYVDGQMLEGSARKIESPAVSTYYFWTALQPNADNTPRTDFSGYTVRELEILNGTPEFDADGTITNFNELNVRVLNSGEEINLSAVRIEKETPDGENPEKNYDYVVSYETGELEGSSRADTVSNTRKGGIAIRLFKWDSDDPLEDGIFTLKDSTGKTIGKYTSDSEGLVTMVYNYEKNKLYTLEQTSAPAGYVGLQKIIKFKVNNDNTISMYYDDGVTPWGTVVDENNDVNWAESNPGENGIDAFVDVYNKPFNFIIAKVDKDDVTNFLDGAHFSLHKRVYTSISGYVKVKEPIDGFEDMVTENGRVDVCGGNSGRVLKPSKNGSSYFLEETVAPDNYAKLEEDIIFALSPIGVPSIIQGEDQGTLVQTEDSYIFTLNVPNAQEFEVTITKAIDGSMGDKTKEFDFTFSVDGDDGSAKTYSWTKNGVEQTEKIKSGDSFKMTHNDVVVIKVPEGTTVTVSEDAEDYEPICRINSESFVAGSSLTETINDNTEMDFKNVLNGIIPTGIFISYGIMVAAGAAIFLFMLTLRRRRRRLEEELKQQK